ncbi:MAG: 3-methyl-2-oxobutanoate dehydrogenase subunit VorB [Verrucomicrobia bacterium]|nr:3-methyl-2-oxobutanoate dehydrogenase subunit VorB [Verrucomicrobiota bacterium]
MAKNDGNGARSERILMCGNEAMAEAAIAAGCRCYFGYPITPQNEVTAYMAKRMPEVGGVFLQSESELAAVNMVFGASAVGARAMTSSSSPGISLKQEGISYLAGCELPAVIANVMRGGPGLGGIGPSQSDYFQATRGGGHGDYRHVVLAASAVQELVDLTIEAFDIADRYRNPVLVLSDGVLGQMMEPVVIPEHAETHEPEKPWALTGCKGREPQWIKSLYLNEHDLERHNQKLQAKYAQMECDEVRYDTRQIEDADVVLVAFGMVARICRSVVRVLRERGVRAGLFRPIAVWPFPYEALRATRERAQAYLVVEMNAGQMVEDVRLAIEGRRPVEFYGRTGGVVMEVEEVVAEVEKLLVREGVS